MTYDEAGNVIFENVVEYAQYEYENSPGDYIAPGDAVLQAVAYWNEQGWELDEPLNIKDIPGIRP